MFAYPVGIQLFNRPEYAEQVLLSLKAQTLPIDQSLLSIFIDGFKGSLYENRGEIDKTLEVENLARAIFPEATICRFEENLGIADLHNRLQTAAFSGEHSWAAFFEEDLILDPIYLQELSDLIDVVNDTNSVVKVACFQILPSQSDLPRGYNGFYPGRGTQAFAERRDFFLEKQPTIQKFLNLISREKHRQDQFTNTQIASKLAAEGYLIPYIQHDALVESYIYSTNKLHVTTRPDLASDIGVKGIHNYTTLKIKKDPKDARNLDSIQSRRVLFLEQVGAIADESAMYTLSQIEEIILAFHMTRSRKAMLIRVFKLSIENLKRKFRF